MHHLADDFQYYWVAQGFDQLGPQQKDRTATESFFAKSFAMKFVKDYKVLDKTSKLKNIQ